MNFTILLFAIGIAYVSIGSVSTACLSVTNICAIWSQIPSITSCLNGANGLTKNQTLVTKYPCLQTISGILTQIEGINCNAYLTDITNNDATSACKWLSQLLTLGTNGNPDTGLVPNLISCICTLINQLINSPDLCKVLNCVLDIICTLGYYMFCLVISGFNQIYKQTGKAPTDPCLCNYLVAASKQLLILLKCACQVRCQSCLSSTIKTGLGYLTTLINELTVIQNNCTAQGLPALVTELIAEQSIFNSGCPGQSC